MIKSASQSSLLDYKKYSSMLAGYTPSSDYKLDEVVLTGNTTSVTFDVSAYSGIYKNLQIRYTAKSDRSSSDGSDGLLTRINGDSGTNYSHHLLYGQWYSGSNSYGSASETTLNAMEYVYIAGTGGSASGIFGVGVMDFLDAFSTNKFKTRRVFWHNGLSSPFQQISLTSNLWRSTSAITSITLSPRYGSNFVPGTRFSLYGSN